MFIAVTPPRRHIRPLFLALDMETFTFYLTTNANEARAFGDKQLQFVTKNFQNLKIKFA
jgi:hypothetical protein